MLALLSTLVFASAATFAVAVVLVTMKGRRGQVVALWADYRSLQQDREFLIYVTSVERPAPAPMSEQQLRRTSRRALIRSEGVRVANSLRVAA